MNLNDKEQKMNELVANYNIAQQPTSGMQKLADEMRDLALDILIETCVGIIQFARLKPDCINSHACALIAEKGLKAAQINKE